MNKENLKPITRSKYINYFHKGAEFGSWLVLDDQLQRSTTDGHCYVLCVCTKCSLTMDYVRDLHLIKKAFPECRHCAPRNNSLGKIDEIPIVKINRWRQGAKNRKLNWNISNEYLATLWQSQHGKCALTGVKLSFSKILSRGERRASLDRKNSRIGYLEGNVQFVSVEVNKLKGTLSDPKLKKICKLVTNNDVKNKQRSDSEQLNLF